MKLREVIIRGYKSIAYEYPVKLSLGDISILLGANGAGKSNIISFFYNAPNTSPSKRIIQAIEGDNKKKYKYNKTLAGKYVTERIGIDELRLQCQHFNEWIENLLNA